MSELLEQEQVEEGPEAQVAMIGDLVSPIVLRPVYLQNPLLGFVVGIEYLAGKYPFMRKVRPDGNCFYRSFLYSYLEGLRRLKDTPAAEAERQRFLEIIKGSKDSLEAVGYSSYTFEDFQSELVDLIERLFAMDSAELLDVFQGSVSDYYTWYMRLVTAMSLKADPETYLPVVFESGCLDIDSFCRNEVEPMGKECDHVQIAALAKQLGLTIHIEYLDGRVNADNSLHVISVGAEFSEASSGDGTPDIRKVTLLYRPGHYDILYSRPV